MRGKTGILVAMLVGVFPCASSQTSADAPHVAVSTFLGQNAGIPAEYSLRMSAAYQPFAKEVNFAYGSISLGLAGLFQATYRREGAIGSLLGHVTPASQLELRLQVMPQREHFPAVSLFLNTMTNTQSERFGNNDLASKRPDLYQRGIRSLTYDAKTTVAGVALSTTLSDVVSFSAALGGREVVWQQKWSQYVFNNGLPVTVNGVMYPLAERTTLRLDWSVGATVQPLPQLALIGEVASLPIVDVDPSSLLLEARQGYVGAMGVRYTLPLPLSIDLYDRWFSSTGDRIGYHQVRLGLSSDLQFSAL